ncbi:MAG TPA: PilZ domain-containing protein [Malonomonas sp.]
MNDQRSFRRLNFETEADILIDNTPVRCRLVDLALQGALFSATEELAVETGKLYQLRITLPDSALTLEFTAELIHQRGLFYGFIFVAENATTMGHLRRLLELNFGDSSEVDREFFHWLKRG